MMLQWIARGLSARRKRRVYRQGDVLLIGVPSPPAEAKRVDWRDRIVLAYGEVTGHAHAIAETHVEAYEHDGRMYLRIEERPATLRHEEHAPIGIAPGGYEVRRQQEYAPDPESFRAWVRPVED